MRRVFVTTFMVMLLVYLNSHKLVHRYLVDIGAEKAAVKFKKW